MTWTARAREITRQSDTLVEQTVRFIKDGTPVKDAPIQYAPGADAASAQANLIAAIKAAIASRGSDGTTLAVPFGTLLDLSDPTPPAPTQAQIDQAAYFAARQKVATISYLLSLGSTHVTQQDLAAAQSTWNALTYNAAWEGVP